MKVIRKNIVIFHESEKHGSSVNWLIINILIPFWVIKFWISIAETGPQRMLSKHKRNCTGYRRNYQVEIVLIMIFRSVPSKSLFEWNRYKSGLFKEITKTRLKLYNLFYCTLSYRTGKIKNKWRTWRLVLITMSYIILVFDNNQSSHSKHHLKINFISWF